MTSDERRILRIIAKGTLLTVLPVTGFVWANGVVWTSVGDPIVTLAAIILTLFSLVAVFFAEMFASHAEEDLMRMQVEFDKKRDNRTAELAARDEKLKQLDQIANVLAGQNHDLRAKLVIAHVKKMDKKEE